MEAIFEKLMEFLREITGITENADSIAGSAESVTGDIESIFGFTDSIAQSGASMAASGASMFASVIFLVLLGLSALNLLLDIVAYLFRSIGMYRLSKNAGRSDGWLAFIPVAWHYVLCDLSDEPFRLFGKTMFKNRRTAFWIWLAVKYLGNWIVDLIGVALGSLLMMIPYVGTILGSIIAVVLPFLPNLFCAFMRGKFLYDAAEVFRPGHRNNKSLAVFSILVEEFLSTDLMTVLMIWGLAKYKPEPRTIEPEYTAQ